MAATVRTAVAAATNPDATIPHGHVSILVVTNIVMGESAAIASKTVQRTTRRRSIRLSAPGK